MLNSILLIILPLFINLTLSITQNLICRNIIYDLSDHSGFIERCFPFKDLDRGERRMEGGGQSKSVCLATRKKPALDRR